MDEKEQERRKKIATTVKQFNEFLKTTLFEKDDIVMLLKTFEMWGVGLRKAKKVSTVGGEG